jgi:lysophospholipase L1-like esterase
MRRIARGARDAAIILVLSLAFAGLLEVGVRVAGRLRSTTWPSTKAARFTVEIHRALELYRRHPFLNASPREGARVVAFGKQASFNSLGYRSPERPRSKPPGVVRIVCSGGSTTFDLLALDDAGTWPWRVETALRRRGLDVEVFNAGFPGWTSLENLISLAIRDVDLAPDVVILYQSINDLQPASHRPFDAQYEHGHAEIVIRALGFDLQPLRWYERSVLVEKSRELVLGESDPWQRLSGPGAGEPVPEVPAEAVTTFERNLRSYVAVAAAADARAVLVTQSIRVRRGSVDADLRYLAQWIEGLEPIAVASQLERFNEVMRVVSREGTALLIDVAREVPWEDGDFADPLHFSGRGSERMADFMARSLELTPLPSVGDTSGPG